MHDESGTMETVMMHDIKYLIMIAVVMVGDDDDDDNDHE